jgi:hypothetical protein
LPVRWLASMVTKPRPSSSTPAAARSSDWMRARRLGGDEDGVALHGGAPVGVHHPGVEVALDRSGSSVDDPDALVGQDPTQPCRQLELGPGRQASDDGDLGTEA